MLFVSFKIGFQKMRLGKKKKKNNWICFYVLKVMKADNAKLNSEPLLFRIACQSALQKVN